MENRSPKKYSCKEILQVVIGLLAIITLIVLVHLTITVFIPAFKRYSSCRKLEKQSVSVGDVLYIGRPDVNNEWQVIAIEDSRVLLINKDYVSFLSFDGQESHFCSHIGRGAHWSYPYIERGQQGVPADEWNSSGIKEWLNEVYLPYEFNQYEQALMCDAGYGNVFLLSSDEYQDYVSGDPDLQIDFPWWLRTSMRYNEGTFPDYVPCKDLPEPEPIYRESDIAIRPAMWMKTGS